MSSGAARLPGHRGGRCRHAAPSWVASAADAAIRARFGSPSRHRRRRGRPGCPDAGYAVGRAVRVRCPPCGPTSVQLVGRTPGVQVSGVQVSGVQVSGVHATKQLPGRCRGHGRDGRLAIAEPTLVAKPQTPAPQEGLGVSRRAALWSWRSRMSERLACRSSVPCPRRLRFRHGVPGGVTVSGRIDRTGGVRKPVRSWRPSWTPDTTARTSDADQACGGSGVEHGSRWSRRTGPGAGRGWGCRREHPHYRPVRSGPGRAGRVVVRGRLAGRMVGRWTLQVSAAWPPPSGRGPYPSARRPQ
jgi:hypothetical protein